MTLQELSALAVVISVIGAAAWTVAWAVNRKAKNGSYSPTPALLTIHDQHVQELHNSLHQTLRVNQQETLQILNRQTEILTRLVALQELMWQEQKNAS